jgi:hypothetical protein
MTLLPVFLELKGKPVSGTIHAFIVQTQAGFEEVCCEVFSSPWPGEHVPAEIAVWLFGAGLSLLSVFARKKK